MSSLWVVISNEKAQQKLQSLIDNGHLEETYSLQYALRAFNEKVKSLVQEKGGHLHLLLYERVVMQVPETVAAQLPSIAEAYEEMFGEKIAVGVGMSFKEATSAAMASRQSEQIELYDPETHSDQAKEKDLLRQSPPYKLIDRNGQLTQKPPTPPSIEEDSEMSNFMVQRTMTELGMAPPPGPESDSEVSQEPADPYQVQEDQEQQLQTDAPDAHQLDDPSMMSQEVPEDFMPSNLLEALLGHPVPDTEDLEDENYEGETGDVDLEQALGEQEEAPVGPLDDVLGPAVGRIPEIMQMASQDPKAFKEAMKYLHKILDVAKKKKLDDTQKKEVEFLAESLEKAKKARKRGAIARGKGTHVTYPVGTRKGRRIKVRLPDGRTVWRSMASGRVKNITGEPVSVKQYNNEVKQDLE